MSLMGHRTTIREISLSRLIVPKTHPATVHVICIWMGNNILRFYRLKYQIKVDFSRNNG